MVFLLNTSKFKLNMHMEAEEMFPVGGVRHQKTSKFFVFRQEESVAGHVGVKGVC
jgi:hypothetical protein